MTKSRVIKSPQAAENQSSLPQETVSNLINRLLDEKDPATVGLRRILKEKQEQGKSFAYRQIPQKELTIPGKTGKVFDKNERRILELEKQLLEMRKEMDAAQSASERAVKAAYEAGVASGSADGEQKGFSKAKAEADAQIAEIQKKINGYLKSLEDSKKRIYADTEHVLLKFCLQLTQKIINTEVTINREAVLAVIKKALGYIADKDKMVIRVSPQDLEMVGMKKDFWAPVTDRLADIAIEADERIQNGGCIIDSNSGVVDARLGVQFSELSDLVEKTWETAYLSQQVSPLKESTAPAVKTVK